ncbi:transient receptor potential cation channel subfamily M member 2-like, partial [Ascaphus truei]|uniref:transient receptor potential cation channel subfamily M member 2-like n=1 Tax=Ascaphus truei TaxID=8439 RepID=UPI003F59D4CC
VLRGGTLILTHVPSQVLRGDTNTHSCPLSGTPRGTLILTHVPSQVLRGYLDDPRNTDNAWVETRAVNLHLESKGDLDSLIKNLQDSGSERSLLWLLVDRRIALYANEKEILQRTAEHLGAQY